MQTLRFAVFSIFISFSTIMCANGQQQWKGAVPFIDLQKNIQKCFEETHVPTALRSSHPMFLLDNPKMKCFNACMMKKKGTMKHGRINPEKQIRLMDAGDYDDVKKVVIACSYAANQQKNECETAYTYANCLIRSVGTL